MKRLTISLILGPLLVLLLASGAYAAAVTVEASATSVDPGQKVSIDIYINNVENFYGASADFIFNPAVVKVESVTGIPDSERTTNLTDNYFVIRNIDQASGPTGAFNYSKCLTGKRAGFNINTKTLLCSINLRAINDGTIPIKPAAWNNKLTDLNLHGNTILIHLANSSAVPIEYSDPGVCYINLKSNTKGGSSGGGGKEYPEVKSQSIGVQGGIIKTGDVVIKIPPQSLNQEINFEIRIINNPSILPMEEGRRLLSDVVEIIQDKETTLTKPITVTLKFDSYALDLENYDLSIYWLDEEKSCWVELNNISVDLEHGSVSGDVGHLTKFAVIANPKTKDQIPKLNDIKGHWAEPAINKLVEKGILKGYLDGSFKPENYISRAEFTFMLVKAIGLNAGGKVGFADLEGHWSRDYIAAAAAKGIVSGYSSVNFAPEDNITREQMAVMAAKAAKLPVSADVEEFKDDNAISPWAREAVKQMLSNNLISGYPDQTFRPPNSVTRAEAAYMIYKLITLDKAN